MKYLRDGLYETTIPRYCPNHLKIYIIMFSNPVKIDCPQCSTLLCEPVVPHCLPALNFGTCTYCTPRTWKELHFSRALYWFRTTLPSNWDCDTHAQVLWPPSEKKETPRVYFKYTTWYCICLYHVTSFVQSVLTQTCGTHNKCHHVVKNNVTNVQTRGIDQHHDHYPKAAKFFVYWEE